MLEVACATDEHYAAPTAAMLHSLLTHLQGMPARVQILHDGSLSAATLARYAALGASMNARCEGRVVEDRHLEGFPTAQFHKSCWYRVLLPDLCPELERILYLDSDLIVADSLAPLWNLPLESRPFAAVSNPIYYFLGNWPRDTLGIADPARYLNSGVLLLDLDHMRRHQLTAQIRRYAAAHPENRYPEQDALSALFHDRFLALHPRWNVQSTLYELPPVALPYSLLETAQALSAPAAIHFIGPFKPWLPDCPHPRRALYFRHLRAAGWDRRSLTARLRDTLRKHAPSAEIAYYRERVTWRWRVRRLPLLLLAALLRAGGGVRRLFGQTAVPLTRSPQP